MSLIYSERTSASGSERLDRSSEGWISDCFNDVDMSFNMEDVYVSFNFNFVLGKIILLTSFLM